MPKLFKRTLSPLAESAPASPADAAFAENRRFIDEMLADWWRVLGNRELEALMDQAFANNTDLRVATLRVAQANARAEQARADEFPVVTLPYEARTEAPADGVGSGAAGRNVVSRRLYQGSLRGDWRLDVWGERRALAESAQMQLRHSIYQHDETLRTVAASVVSQYIEYLSLNDRLRIARETEIALRGMLEDVGGRLKAGDATITDLEQQRAAVYAVRATIPALELQRETAINSLAQLLGTTPGSLALSHSGLDSLAFPRVLPSVPVNLLLRRPDVKAIEARLLAADADIDVARARLLPSIDLTSQVGYGSLWFSRLFQPYNLAWNAIANLSATIFDHGKRSNDVVFAQAFREELVEAYVRVIYSAIRETEDAIASVQLNAKRLDAQNTAVKAAKRAWNFSIESYRAGAIDHLVLLDTERTYHRTLDEFHRVSMERYKGLVSLFSALGGGIPIDSRALPRDDAHTDVIGTERAARAAALAMNQVHRQGLESEDDRPYWLVELAGLQDRAGVGHVWRDLIHRFPDLMSDLVIRPRLQGRVAGEKKEWFAWYRLFVAKFSSAESARVFCDRLGAALIRCRSVPSDSPAYQEVLDSPTVEAARTSETPIADRAGTFQVRHAAVQTAPALSTPVSILPREPSVLPAPQVDKRVDNLPEADTEPDNKALDRSAPDAWRILDSAPRQAESKTVLPPQPAEPQKSMPEMATTMPRIGYAVQLFTLSSGENAATASEKWSRDGYESYVYPVVSATGNVQFTVRSGIYPNRQQAAAEAAAIRRKTQIFAIAVPVVLDKIGKPAASMELAKKTLDRSAAGQAWPTPSPVQPRFGRQPAPQPKPAAAQEGMSENVIPAPRIAYAVQLATLSSDSEATAVSRIWTRKGYQTYLYPVVDATGKVQFTVRTGIYPSRRQAAAEAAAIRRKTRTFAVTVTVVLDKIGQSTPKLVSNML